MNEHISYAMRNEEAIQSLIYFNMPSNLLGWSFLLIQAVIFAGALLALAHAYLQLKKTGSYSALLTLLNCFLYGLSIDILSYYTVENFWHGEFSIMLLYNKLPLYIALFYPAFMYHAYMLICSYKLTAVIEPICIGFFSGFMYLIFDNLGPMLNWWVWDTTDSTTLPYISNVPLTSYHWFFTFTMAFALINRAISWQWLGHISKLNMCIAVIFQPIFTILLGSLLFIPYNLLAKNMPPYDMMPWDKYLGLATAVHVISFSLAGLIFLTHCRKTQGAKDYLLMAFPIAYLLSHAVLYATEFEILSTRNEHGLIDGLALSTWFIIVIAFIGSSVITWRSAVK